MKIIRTAYNRGLVLAGEIKSGTCFETPLPDVDRCLYMRIGAAGRVTDSVLSVNMATGARRGFAYSRPVKAVDATVHINE